jgi:structure-specific recognition protein 1
MEDVSYSTKGWNWGTYKLDSNNLLFSVNGQKCFTIDYKDIAISNASGKNEVAMEFH